MNRDFSRCGTTVLRGALVRDPPRRPSSTSDALPSRPDGWLPRHPLLAAQPPRAAIRRLAVPVKRRLHQLPDSAVAEPPIREVAGFALSEKHVRLSLRGVVGVMLAVGQLPHLDEHLVVAVQRTGPPQTSGRKSGAKPVVAVQTPPPWQSPGWGAAAVVM